MPYRYLGEIATADVAFEATGNSLEEAFAAAAEATLNVMIEEPERIERRESIDVELENDDLEMLLFDFLNELVYYKDSKKLLLRVDEVKIEVEGRFRLRAKLSGEMIDPMKHPLGADVKAVTLHRFSLLRSGDGWTATAVLDI
ncbi:MAG TPA: archease [Thermodesulfobacteriota bacterium]